MAYIVSELHSQYGGNIRLAEQMILQSKMGGADAVKVQIYDSMKLFKNRDRDFLSLSFKEVVHLKKYADQLRIDFFASPFDIERLTWCLKLDFPVLKAANIATRELKDLCDSMVKTGKSVYVSLNKRQIAAGKPYKEKNVHYLYTEPTYPATLEDVEIPDFNNSWFEGYSDHTIGLTAAFYALSRGAKIIEKHFTVDHSWQQALEKVHVASMDVHELQQLRGFARGIEILQRKTAKI
jgi:sialic acid synthase SpsE